MDFSEEAVCDFSHLFFINLRRPLAHPVNFFFTQISSLGDLRGLYRFPGDSGAADDNRTCKLTPIKSLGKGDVNSQE